MLDIGICGKPNSGKSTFFSAATLVDVPIANYPFTTIQANVGIAYVRARCPCKGFGVKCSPKNAACIDGMRLVPTKIIDVAGLVPGAHEGRGLGNKFLDDLRTARAIIQVVDVSGTTDIEGKAVQGADPIKEVDMLEEEMARWVAGIIKRGTGTRKMVKAEEMAVLLSGLGIAREHVNAACDAVGQQHDEIAFENDGGLLEFSKALRKKAKPLLIAANKIDLPGAEKNAAALMEVVGKENMIGCYADGELALRKAERAGIINYVPGAARFEMMNADARQASALEKIQAVMERNNGTGVQQAIDRAAFGLLGLIVVYPVEDETRLSDQKGNVLPDAFLIRKGSTPIDLAREIHTDLAEKFICAVDVKKGRKMGKEHVLEDGDVVKIVKGR
ncbi:MAG: redox-regulated ATPase YchF [Candidatus Burarchaeum sp.]|nr:redox-regulated ATPase YchF [Candidatus Burarchaeum sp.]MDO8339762.1 redox-regulated ATPase YchF [Candidatus Burarchaeum sp.]